MKYTEIEKETQRLAIDRLNEMWQDWKQFE